MGVHLRRTDENVREIDALGTLLGGAVGVDAVLADLNRKASRTFVLGRARLGRAETRPIRIVAALVNPVGGDPEIETVTLLNACPQPLDMAGWDPQDPQPQPYPRRYLLLGAAIVVAAVVALVLVR